MNKEKFVKVKINTAIYNYPVGSIHKVAVDKEGTPLDSEWRRIFLEALVDKCIETVKAEIKPKLKKDKGGS